jgi:hypothetical protein
MQNYLVHYVNDTAMLKVPQHYRYSQVNSHQLDVNESAYYNSCSPIFQCCQLRFRGKLSCLNFPSHVFHMVDDTVRRQYCQSVTNFFWCGGTKSTRYCGHFWPIVQAPDDR